MDVKTYETEFEKDGYEISSDKMVASFIVEPRPNSNLYQIRLAGGGAIPERLKGSYTSAHLAMKKIKEHLGGMKPTKARERDIKTERRESAKV